MLISSAHSDEGMEGTFGREIIERLSLPVPSDACVGTNLQHRDIYARRSIAMAPSSQGSTCGMIMTSLVYTDDGQPCHCGQVQWKKRR